MTEEELLVLYYRLLRQHGLNDSHSGNGSVRLNNYFAVTKTGACADTIEVNQLVLCNLDDSLPDNASLDACIHRTIYQNLNNCRAVLHSHNPYTIALTLNDD